MISDLFGNFGRRNPVKVVAGCAEVSTLDSRACGAVVHVVEKFLQLPKKNIIESLESDPEFSIFHTMIKVRLNPNTLLFQSNNYVYYFRMQKWRLNFLKMVPSLY